ncbi:hypothetical protein M3J09_008741 [Ascochyta lentis]
MPDIDCIREQLSLYPGSRLGSVIYRLTYSDDAQWARFMSHLNMRVRLGLEEDGDGDLFGHINWTVQEDTELDESLYETNDDIHEMLRRRHTTYAIQHPEDVNSVYRDFWPLLLSRRIMWTGSWTVLYQKATIRVKVS